MLILLKEHIKRHTYECPGPTLRPLKGLKEGDNHFLEKALPFPQ